MICTSFVIPGFLQKRGGACGLWKLREKLLTAGLSAGRDHRVVFDHWHANWADHAKDLADLRDWHNAGIMVGIVAYSWGAGWGAMKLARELQIRNLYVKTMVLCDPVSRPWLLPLRVAALVRRDLGRWLPSPAITIPSNVYRVRSFYQQNSRPQGHVLRAAHPRTRILDPVELDATHLTIDEHPEFQAVALREMIRLHDLGPGTEVVE